MSASGDCDRWAGRVGQSGPVGQPWYPTQYELQRIEQRREQTEMKL